jgi:tetratricopeptide (TPR) repeat protein
MIPSRWIWQFTGLCAVGGLWVTLARAEPSVAMTFRVDDSTSLSEISLRLYGTANKWRKIAEWNQLAPPYRVRLNQVLKLRDPPTLGPEEGKQKLLAMWRRRMGVAASEVGVAASEVGAAPKEKQEEQKKHEEVKLQSEFVATFHEDEVEAKKDLPPQQAERERSYDDYFKEGEAQDKSRHFEEAAASFKKAREINPKSFAAWLCEIAVLKKLGRQAEAKTTAMALVEREPQLKNIPVIRNLLNGEGAPSP